MRPVKSDCVRYKAERDRFEQELIATEPCTELKSALSGKEGDPVAVNAELTELHKLNESLSADLNKVTLVSQAMKRKWLNKAMNSKRSCQSNEAGSYPEAEKTISESLERHH